MQAKLLRVLQEREIERVGGNETIKVDVRVVAATNRDLVTACEDGRVPRGPLLPPQRACRSHMPPLRERREDIPLLARHFLELAAQANDRPGHDASTDGAMQALVAYSYPGNVRELRNLVERLVILTPDETIDERRREDLPRRAAAAPKAPGLYRAGRPVPRARRGGGAQPSWRRRSRITAGRWPRRRARSGSSAATSTRRQGARPARRQGRRRRTSRQRREAALPGGRAGGGSARRRAGGRSAIRQGGERGSLRMRPPPGMSPFGPCLLGRFVARHTRRA